MVKHEIIFTINYPESPKFQPEPYRYSLTSNVFCLCSNCNFPIKKGDKIYITGYLNKRICENCNNEISAKWELYCEKLKEYENNMQEVRLARAIQLEEVFFEKFAVKITDAIDYV